jgi:hypothetical protein
MHQNAIAARSAILFATVVHASKRVFEDILRSPRHLRRTTIAPVFEEFELEFQNFQEVTLILLHLDLRLWLVSISPK